MSESANKSLPNSWSLANLNVVATLVRGVTYKREDAISSATDGYLPLLRATNITGSSLTFDDLVFVPRRCISNEQLLIPGDVVIASSSGSKEIVGKSGQIIGGLFGGSFGAFCTGIRPSQMMFDRYLGYYFQTPNYRNVISDLSAGSNINNIKSSELAEHSIPIAPRTEQTRIVEKLEELFSDLDAGVAELKAAQKKLGQYRQSLLKAAVEGALTAEWRAARKVGAGDTALETGGQLLERILTERRARREAKQLAKFAEQGKAPPKDWQKKYPEPVQPDTSDLPELPEGWIWASVAQVGEVTTGFTPSTTNPDFFGGEIPFFKPTDLDSGYEVFEFRESLTEAGAANGRVLPEKSVLVTCIGATIGKTGLARVRCATNQQINAISVLDGRPLPEFVFWVMTSDFGQRQIIGNASATTLPILNKSKFERLAVPVPPATEQQEIVNCIERETERVSEQLQAIEHGLKQSAAQRKNILKAAFSGQLVPQDPDDEPASLLLERIRAERVERDKQPKVRKTKLHKEIAAMVSKLMDVLAEAGDWVPAQEAFRRCGVADGAQTEQLEALYAELRALDKAGRLAVEPVTDTQGRKLHDRLKLLAA